MLGTKNVYYVVFYSSMCLFFTVPWWRGVCFTGGVMVEMICVQRVLVLILARGESQTFSWKGEPRELL